MEFKITTKIKISYYNYLTCVGLEEEPVSGINIITTENTLKKPVPCTLINKCEEVIVNNNDIISQYYIKPPGYTFEYETIIDIFQKKVGSKINNKTLVQLNTYPKISYLPYPIYYVNFPPSNENVAMYIFRELYNPILDITGSSLLAIEILSENYITEYFS